MDGPVTYETEQPWVVWRFGLTHDLWWTPKGSTRWWGRMRVEATCAVCGASEVLVARIPRWGTVPEPASGRAPVRQAFLDRHRHPERGAPMSWAMPLLVPHCLGPNWADALAVRLQAELGATPDDLGGH